MQKTVWPLLVALMLLLFAGCTSPANSSPPAAPEGEQSAPEENSDIPEENGKEKVLLGVEVFYLELADTDEKRALGLMYRSSLEDNAGMLFVFPDVEERVFWMKDCLIPIDVIFLDEEGCIVSIREMTPPEPGTSDLDLELYRSDYPAKYAIEIKGGRAFDLGLAPGQTIELRREYLDELAGS